MSTRTATVTAGAGAPAPAKAPDELARRLRLGGNARLRKLLTRGLWIAAALAVAIAIGRWWRARGATPPPAYVTAPVTRGELDVTVSATGALEARNLVQIGCEVSGRIASVEVRENDVVHAGQVLAEIDPELLDAQVAQARAQLAQAEAALVQARATDRDAARTRVRTAGLFDAGVVSAADRDAAATAAERATAAVAVARADIERATAALRIAETNLTRAVIRSPIDGVVLTRDVEVGQTVVAAFQAPVLFQIAEDLAAMKVSVDIDEADVGLVHEGQAATFTVAAYLGRTFDARVATVHNAARLVDRVVTYEAELEVDNHDLLLRPGMTVTAQIVARRLPDALQVPGAALRLTPPGQAAPAPGDPPRLWLLRDGAPVAVPVEVLAQNDTHAAVTGAGIAPGAAVIVDVR